MAGALQSIMDDEQYRQTREAIDSPPCLYGKAVQYGYFMCQHAHSITLGEREAMHCQHMQGYANCKEYYFLSLEKSGFALGTTPLPAHLTFNKAMQVQIGGLQGVMNIAGVAESEGPSKKPVPAADIANCFRRLKATTADFKHLNFSRVVPYIQRFSLRKHGRGEPS